MDVSFIEIESFGIFNAGWSCPKAAVGATPRTCGLLNMPTSACNEDDCRVSKIAQWLALQSLAERPLN